MTSLADLDRDLHYIVGSLVLMRLMEPTQQLAIQQPGLTTRQTETEEEDWSSMGLQLLLPLFEITGL